MQCDAYEEPVEKEFIGPGRIMHSPIENDGMSETLRGYYESYSSND